MEGDQVTLPPRPPTKASHQGSEVGIGQKVGEEKVEEEKVEEWEEKKKSLAGGRAQ